MLLNLLGQNAGIIGRARYFFWVRNYTLTLRVGLIALCLVLTTATALLIAKSGPILGLAPVGFILVVAGFLFVYHNLEATLLIILVVSTLLHVGVGTGTGTPVTFTFALLTIVPLVWLVRMTVVDKSFNLRRLPANLPALLFMITVIISAFWSGGFVDDEIRYLFMDKVNPRVMTAVSIIVSVLTYFLFANCIHSIRSMRFYVWWFIAIGSIHASFGLLGLETPNFINQKGQLSTWVIILALGQALFNKDLSRKLRLFCIILSGVLFTISFNGITWLSGWVPSLLGFGILAFLRSRKLFALLLIVVALIAVLNFGRWGGVINAENNESGTTRSEAWDRVFDLIGNHLLFGSGPAGYHFYFTVTIGGFYQLSHNNYVDILAQTGVVGFTFFIWMWLAIGWVGWQTYRSVPRQGFRHGLAGSLLAAYFISLVSMMLGDWITPFPYTQTLAGIDYTIWHWMMAGLSVALFYEAKRTSTLSHSTITVP